MSTLVEAGLSQREVLEKQHEITVREEIETFRAKAQDFLAGLITEVQSVKGGPWGIGRGSDGAIWLTQTDGNRIGRFTLAP